MLSRVTSKEIVGSRSRLDVDDQLRDDSVVIDSKSTTPLAVSNIQYKIKVTNSSFKSYLK